MDRDFAYKLYSINYGLAVGDALGVPYEFLDREEMENYPCTDMIGYGTYNQPPGSWSDDTSLTLCLLDGIDYYNHTIDFGKVKQNMIDWKNNNAFTANNIRFDIGNTTSIAIQNMEKGEDIFKCGVSDKRNNGNGSLMRISPLVLFLKDEDDIQERFNLVQKVSSMTHSHIISVIGCHIYIEYMLQLLKNDHLSNLEETIKILDDFYKNSNYATEYAMFERITKLTFLQPIYVSSRLYANKKEYDTSIIKSSGYIVDTLEASIFCFLSTYSYDSSVLKAVNLGEDTDTIAAITGSMSGLYYGYDNIFKKWIADLLNKPLIDKIIKEKYT